MTTILTSDEPCYAISGSWPLLSSYTVLQKTTSNTLVSFLLMPFPVSILYKSIAGRYRPVRVADGPITARYRFIKNAYKSIAGRYRPVRVADGPITARYRFIKNAYWVVTRAMVVCLIKRGMGHSLR